MSRILVIDDDRIVRETLKVILTQGRHEFHFANDGRQGLAAFTEYKPDLVITDILMPEKEGIETIRDIRRLAAKVPIIAISGGGRVGNMSFLQVAEQFGANRAFAKPFEPKELLQAIDDLVTKTVVTP